MQKVQPAKNNFDMNFLNTFDKPIGGNMTTTATPAAGQPVNIENHPAEVTEIDPTASMGREFNTPEISIDDAPVSRAIKATQIVVRTTEKERETLKSYFMRHGVSLSKGIKIAIKYLEQQEKKGLVHFSDIGLY